MCMEVFHVYGRFSMYMDLFDVYGEFGRIWRFCIHVYGGSLCIWRVFPCMWRYFCFRMEFPEFGMICSVQGCLPSSFNRKFDQLKRHWYNIHVQEITMHQCSYCKKDFVEKRHAKSHVKSHRTPAESSISITDFKKGNNQYMSPGPATLPRPRTMPRSTVTHLSARGQAAERRRRLAEV